MSLWDWLRGRRRLPVPPERTQALGLAPLVVYEGENLERTDPTFRRVHHDRRVDEPRILTSGRLRCVIVPLTDPEWVRATKEARGGDRGEIVRRWANLPPLRR